MNDYETEPKVKKKRKRPLGCSIVLYLFWLVVGFFFIIICIILSPYIKSKFITTSKEQYSLVYALNKKDTKTVKWLLKTHSGLDIHKKAVWIMDSYWFSYDYADSTPPKLLDSVFFEDPQLVRLLLKNGLKVSELISDFETVMQNASIQDYRFFIQYIILNSSYKKLSYHKSKPDFYKEDYFDKSYNFKFYKTHFSLDKILVSSLINPIFNHIIHYLFYKKTSDYNKITQLYNYYKKRAFLGAIRGSNLKLATYLLKEERLYPKNYTKNDLNSLIESVLKSKEPFKTLQFLKSIEMKINLSKEKNQNPFYILNDNDPKIKKMVFYLLEKLPLKKGQKLFDIQKLILQNKINIVLALIEKKGKKLFENVNKQELFSNLILAQSKIIKSKIKPHKNKGATEDKSLNIADKDTEKYYKLMRYLLKELKLNPNIEANLKYEPLVITAVKHNNIKALKLLLRFGAKIKVQNNLKETALYWAIKNKNDKIVETILEKKQKYYLSFKEKKAVLNCFKNLDRNLHVLEALFKTPYLKGYANLQDLEGKSLLMKAVAQRNQEIVKLLLKKGAKVNLKDKNKNTALMFSEDYEIIKTLLNHGAKVNAKNNEGKTALMFSKNYKISKILLNHGAKVNLKDKKGHTALMYSALRSKLTIFNLLLKAGADIYIKDNLGNNLLILFCLNRQKGDSFYRKSYQILKYLCKKFKVDERNPNGDTALMVLIKYASKYSSWIPKTETLISEGNTNVNLKDKQGVRIIFMSSPLKPGYKKSKILKPYHELVKVLRRSENLNLNVLNKEGYSPLMLLLIEGVEKFYVEPALEKGANPNLISNEGKTALDYAYESKRYHFSNYRKTIQKRVIKVLRKYGAKRSSELIDK